jgi:hypothetical protein
LQTSPLPLGYRALSNTLAFRAEKVYLRGKRRFERNSGAPAVQFLNRLAKLKAFLLDWNYIAKAS